MAPRVRTVAWTAAGRAPMAPLPEAHLQFLATAASLFAITLGSAAAAVALALAPFLIAQAPLSVAALAVVCWPLAVFPAALAVVFGALAAEAARDRLNRRGP